MAQIDRFQLVSLDVTIIDGDANHADVLKQAIAGSDLVCVSFVDHGINAELTRKIIETMDEISVKRLISSNILGIYDEVKGKHRLC